MGQKPALWPGLPGLAIYSQNGLFWLFFDPLAIKFFDLAIFHFLATFFGYFSSLWLFLKIFGYLAIFWLFLAVNFKVLLFFCPDLAIFGYFSGKIFHHFFFQFFKKNLKYFFQFLFLNFENWIFPEWSETPRKAIKKGVTFLAIFWLFFVPDLAIFEFSDLATL